MSYVIRHKTTGKYLQGEHAWTGRVDHALHFNSGTRLITYLEQTGEHRAEDALEVISVSPADERLGIAPPPTAKKSRS